MPTTAGRAKAIRPEPAPSYFAVHRRRVLGLMALAAIYIVVAYAVPRPPAVSDAGWRVTAVFLATIAG
jgi:hypothetical protein